MNLYVVIAIALIAGVGTVFSFAPYGYWPLSLVTLFALFCSIYKQPRYAGLLLFTFHLALYSLGLSWIKVSMIDFGGLSPPFANVLIVLLAIYLASFYLLAGWIWSQLAKRQSLCMAWLLTLPALWLIADGLRGVVLTGFPWLLLGYSQIDSFFASLAPFFGVQGITLALLWVVGGLMLYFVAGIKDKRTFLPTCAMVLFVAFIYPFQFVTAQAPVQAALVQGNINQELKWDPNYFGPTLDTYTRLTEKISPQTKLIIWPESALPAYEHELYPFLLFMNEQLRKLGKSLLTGVLEYDQQYDRYYNSVLALGDNGEHTYQRAQGNRYAKEHLLPIGEYVPWLWLREVAPFFNLPESAFNPGQRNQPPLVLGQQIATPAICYEIAFAEQLRARMSADTTLIVTVSNDTWFGRSIGPWQHAQIARMRALEFARPVLRATNTGITQMIDAHGQILAELPAFKAGVLEAQITPHTGMTPYQWWGRWPILLFIGVVFFANFRSFTTARTAAAKNSSLLEAD